jgi:hypothetical protein
VVGGCIDFGEPSVDVDRLHKQNQVNNVR